MHLRRFAAILLTSAALVLSSHGRTEAQGGYAPSGWTPLGHIVLDKNGCESCKAMFPTPQRHLAFALTSDSPFAVSLSGRVDVECADLSSYNVLLGSPLRGGVFQLVANSCINYDSTKVRLTITNVGLSSPDKERGIVIAAYGILR